MAMTTSTEAQAWIEGLPAWCEVRRCERHAGSVIEYGHADYRQQVARCVNHAASMLQTGVGDPPAESVRRPLYLRS